MNLIKKETNNNQMYYYFSELKAIDKKALRRVGFEFAYTDKVDGKKCEVWIKGGTIC